MAELSCLDTLAMAVPYCLAVGTAVHALLLDRVEHTTMRYCYLFNKLLLLHQKRIDVGEVLITEYSEEQRNSAPATVAATAVVVVVVVVVAVSVFFTSLLMLVLLLYAVAADVDHFVFLLLMHTRYTINNAR